MLQCMEFSTNLINGDLTEVFRDVNNNKNVKFDFSPQLIETGSPMVNLSQNQQIKNVQHSPIESLLTNEQTGTTDINWLICGVVSLNPHTAYFACILLIIGIVLKYMTTE